MQHNGRTPDRCEKQWQFHLHANVGGPESGGISTQWEYNPLRWVTLSPYLWMKKGESGEGMYLENAACHDVHPQRLRSHCRIISLLQLIRLVSSLIWQSDWRYPISIHPLNKKKEEVGRKENALLVRRHPRLNDSKFPLSLALSGSPWGNHQEDEIICVASSHPSACSSGHQTPWKIAGQRSNYHHD